MNASRIVAPVRRARSISRAASSRPKSRVRAPVSSSVARALEQVRGGRSDPQGLASLGCGELAIRRRPCSVVRRPRAVGGRALAIASGALEHLLGARARCALAVAASRQRVARLGAAVAERGRRVARSSALQGPRVVLVEPGLERGCGIAWRCGWRARSARPSPQSGRAARASSLRTRCRSGRSRMRPAHRARRLDDGEDGAARSESANRRRPSRRARVVAVPECCTQDGRDNRIVQPALGAAPRDDHLGAAHHRGDVVIRRLAQRGQCTGGSNAAIDGP